MKRLRGYLVAGILVWLPLGVTLLLLRVLINLVDRTLLLLPNNYHPNQWLEFSVPWSDSAFSIPGLGLVLTFVVLIMTGILATNIVGRSAVSLWERMLERIPIVRSIYSAAKNFAEIVFSDSSQSFKKVLLIEYPRKGLYSLAFQTSSELGEVQGRTGEEVVCTFVPTTPNPTSGFIIIVPRKDIVELDMDIDEALKMVISLGVVVPTWRQDELGQLPLEMPADENS